jgi:hypothetical protein
MLAFRFAVFLVISFFSTVASAEPTLEIMVGGETITLSRSELESLPQQRITTTSPYFEGTQEFSGPSLQTLIDTYWQPGNERILFRALNDYAVEAPLQQALALDAIIATRRNSRVMSVRTHGPFWVMLPLSQQPSLNTTDNHRFMIWQLSEIELN